MHTAAPLRKIRDPMVGYICADCTLLGPTQIDGAFVRDMHGTHVSVELLNHPTTHKQSVDSKQS